MEVNTERLGTVATITMSIFFGVLFNSEQKKSEHDRIMASGPPPEMGEDQPLTGGLEGSLSKQFFEGKLVGRAQMHQDPTEAENQSPKRYEGMESKSQPLECYYFYLCMQMISLIESRSVHEFTCADC